MSGRPQLPTPIGTFHVFAKLSPTTFYSPFPKSSPYWYAPTHINYALEFLAGGFFLHDSWWHSVYGPGTNGWHYDPRFGWQWGSHGCVAMPISAAAWLYNWAPIGTTVEIVPYKDLKRCCIENFLQKIFYTTSLQIFLNLFSCGSADDEGFDLVDLAAPVW
jgi:hypothetical protein